MTTLNANWRPGKIAILGISVLLLFGGAAAFAQAPASPPPEQHAMSDAADQHKQLADQITNLRAQVVRLQAAVQQTGPGKTSTANAGTSKGMGGMGMAAPGTAAMPAGGGGMGMGMGMGMMGDKGEMGAMPPGGNAAMPPGGGGMGMMGDKGEMGAMPPGGNAAMPPGGKGAMPGAPAAAMGMCCMGEMGGMPGGASGGMSGAAPPGGGMAAMSAPASAMPGQPGASHLYHVGSTGFFLNHPQHITLTADQKLTLNRLKERAMFDRASEQRKIDQAEQELYTLTGADQLDNSKLQAKIGEIEKLRGEQRLNFIRAVGEASDVLTHAQHQALLGTMAASKK